MAALAPVCLLLVVRWSCIICLNRLARGLGEGLGEGLVMPEEVADLDLGPHPNRLPYREGAGHGYSDGDGERYGSDFADGYSHVH